MHLEQTSLQYLTHSYERQPSPLSYGRQQLYGLGMPGPEVDLQQAAGEAMSRYPLGPKTLSMRPQSLQQQYGVSHSLYPVVPTLPIPSSWPEQSTQHDGATPPQRGGPTPGRARPLAQAAYDDERERQGQSWTPPSLPDSPLPVYNMSPPSSQPQPLWGKGEGDNEVKAEAEGDKEGDEKGEEEGNGEDDDNDNDNGKGEGEVNDSGKEKEAEEDDVWTYIIVLTFMVGLQFVVSMVA
jgi:hypothetical protein